MALIREYKTDKNGRDIERNDERDPVPEVLITAIQSAIRGLSPKDMAAVDLWSGNNPWWREDIAELFEV